MDSHKIAITQALDSNTVNKDRADQLVVYLCSKYSVDINTNSNDAKRYSRFAVEQGVIPIAPHLLFPVFMDEKTERDIAMYMSEVLISSVDELWVFGNELSSGMKVEVEVAKKLKKAIRYLTSNARNKYQDVRSVLKCNLLFIQQTAQVMLQIAIIQIE